MSKNLLHLWQCGWTTILLALLVTTATAQPTPTKPSEKVQLKATSVDDYIKKYSRIAKDEMRRTGIPASISLAQGVLESNFGNSELAKNANNHFGIKCHKDWNGKGYYMDDDAKNECFRVYDTPEDSYRDHSDFLKGRQNYIGLFQLDPKDYKSWAKGLKNAGYATNPQYANLLIRIIEEHQLSKLDEQEVKEDAPKSKEEAVASFDNKIVMFNNIKTVIVQQGETYDDIARKFNIKKKRLLAYNDFTEGDSLPLGAKVYLQPKRFMGFNKVHEVKKGENMKVISQKEGIKLWSLYRKNRLGWGQEPAVGQVLTLKSRNANAPKLRDENEVRQEIRDAIDARTKQQREVFVKERTDSIIKADSLAALNALTVKTAPAKPIVETIVAAKLDTQTATVVANNSIAPTSDTVRKVDTTVVVAAKELKDIPVTEKPFDTTGIAKVDNLGVPKNIEPTDSIAMSAVTQKSIARDTSESNKLPLDDIKIGKVAEVKETKEAAKIDSVARPNISLATKDTLPTKAKPNVIAKNDTVIKPEEVTIKPIKEVAAKEAKEADRKDVKKQTDKRGNALYHQVKPRETLFSIAQLYYTSVDSVKRWNNLDTAAINVGQNLIIAYGEIPKPKVIEMINKPNPVEPPKPNATSEYHIVKAGEGLMAVARTYKITVDQIRQWNKLKSDDLKVGQKLLVYNNNPQPAVEKLPLEKEILQNKKDKTPIYHIVKPGQTLTSLAKEYDVTIEQLRKWNNLTGDLKTGTKLVISYDVEQNTKDEGTARYHVIAPSETMYSLARTYGVTVKQLQQWNKMSDFNIKVGQKIIVGY